ncbi:hypothetical protein Vi05172_g1126 [Venturia inaequalis]|nr:hypothetical protein Vi05172_g1126 [Venturia inaequalis]
MLNPRSDIRLAKLQRLRTPLWVSRPHAFTSDGRVPMPQYTSNEQLEFLTKRKAELAAAKNRKSAFAAQERQQSTARADQQRAAALQPPTKASAALQPIKKFSAGASRQHKISKRPQKSLKSPVEVIRQRQERRDRASKILRRNQAIKDRDELLSDHSSTVNALTNLTRALENMYSNNPRRKELADECKTLRDILSDIDGKLAEALGRVEKYGADAEEKAEREAFAAEIRTGNEIVAKQAAERRTPYAQATKNAILDEQNPWPDRPNYRPGLTFLKPIAFREFPHKN